MKEVYVIVFDFQVKTSDVNSVVIDTSIAPVFLDVDDARRFMSNLDDSCLYSIVALGAVGDL